MQTCVTVHKLASIAYSQLLLYIFIIIYAPLMINTYKVIIINNSVAWWLPYRVKINAST